MKKMLYLLLTLVMVFLLITVGYAQEETGLIHGWAFNDLNANGIREIGEFGLTETVICLGGLDFDWCDHTEWGEYEFDSLAAGRYRVKLVDFPEGYRLTTRRQYVIKLEAGELRTAVHFGLVEIPRKGSR
jgi:pimeloyl-ACP methyl ester carboxylesterase